jgi:hypothetical protein
MSSSAARPPRTKCRVCLTRPIRSPSTLARDAQAKRLIAATLTRADAYELLSDWLEAAAPELDGVCSEKCWGET